MLVEDETGDVLLVFFLANHQWIARSLPVGARRWVSGKLELWDGHRQMVHPDRILDAEGFAKMAPVEPVYPATEGLTQRMISKAVEGGAGAPPRAAGMADAAGSDLIRRRAAPRASPAGARRDWPGHAGPRTPRL